MDHPSTSQQDHLDCTSVGVIFDLDGLLVDTEPLWSESARQLLARRGREPDPAIKPLVMGRTPIVVAGIYVEHYRLADEPEALLAERLELLQQVYAERGIATLPGATELLAELSSRQLAMAVASGSPSSLVGEVLARAGIRAGLDTLVGSDQVSRGKPAPDIFLHAAALIEREPARCVVFEDSAAGIDAALAAGMGCIAVPSPETPAERAGRAHRVLGSLAEASLEMIVEVVDQVGGG